MASRAIVWHEIQRIREAVIVVHYTAPELMPYISNTLSNDWQLMYPWMKDSAMTGNVHTRARKWKTGSWWKPS